ncbi:MAG: precorrin-4 C(11)-methyltransferase [Micropruina sp.]
MSNPPDSSRAPHSLGQRHGEVVFVGAGPGAPDLITLRGAQVIAEADIVIWASSLVDAAIVAGAKPGATVIDSASLPLEGIEPLYRRARDEGLLLARVHTGDPSIYGATAEQRRICERLGIAHRTIPGVSAFSAAAARADAEITVPEVSQTLILTRLEGGRTPMPPRETVRGFAAHGATMALYLSAARNKALQHELLAGGYPPETPCIVGYRVSWPDELMLRCHLGELSATMAQYKLWKHTVVLVGPALGAQGETRSHLYHPGFRHEYRDAEGAPPVPAPDTIHRRPRGSSDSTGDRSATPGAGPGGPPAAPPSAQTRRSASATLASNVQRPR